MVKPIIYYDLFSTASEQKDNEIHYNCFHVWVNFEGTIRNLSSREQLKKGLAQQIHLTFVNIKKIKLLKYQPLSTIAVKSREVQGPSAGDRAGDYL